MKRFRITFEIESIVEKKDVLQDLVDGKLFTKGVRDNLKVQRVNGKRKSKPNPNQLDLEGVYESAQKMQDRINKRIQDKIDNTGLEA